MSMFRDLLMLSKKKSYILDGMLRWYKLDGDFVDSASGYNATNYGLTFSQDAIGVQTVCNLGSGYATIPVTGLPSNTSFSISILTRPTAAQTSGLQLIFGYGIDGVYKVSILGRMNSYICSERGSGEVITTTPMYDAQNKWKRITSTYNESTRSFKIYCNTTLIYSTTQNYDIVPSLGIIGSWLNGVTTYRFYGQLSNAMIYNRDLTIEEIENNYLVDKENFDM
jgi:hypothetical protein